MQAARITDTSTKALCADLGNPNSWTRETAHRILLERQDKASAKALRQVLSGSPSPEARLHALYLLKGIGALGTEHIQDALKDHAAEVREHAIDLARPNLDKTPPLLDAIRALVTDPDARVRFACALALGDVPGEAKVAPLVQIAMQGLDDPWTREAVFSSIGDCIGPFAQAFLKAAPETDSGSPDALKQVGRMIALSQKPETTGAFSARILDRDGGRYQDWALAAIEGVAAGVESGKQFPAGPSPLDRLANSGLHDDGSRQALHALVRHCIDTAGAKQASIPARVSAIALLGYAGFDTAGKTLEALLTPQAPEDLEVAAVQALSHMHDDRVAKTLLAADRWRAFTPLVRTAALAALFSRGQRINALLDALQSGAIQPASIDPVHRAQLQRSGNEEIRKRAQKIFAQVETADRLDVYNDYKSILKMPGDPVVGKKMFQQVCAACHKYKGMGYSVAPDLSDIRTQPLESILFQIICPNSQVVAGYQNYVVEMTSGESQAGVIAAESDSSVTLRQPLGIEYTIPRNKIRRVYSTGLSLMPEDLEKGMTRQQLRDVLAFLKGEPGKAAPSSHKTQ